MLADVNRMAKKYKLKIKRGRGYWYWISNDKETSELLAGIYSDSVGVYNIDDLSLESWKREIEDVVQQMKDLKAEQRAYKNESRNEGTSLRKLMGDI